VFPYIGRTELVFATIAASPIVGSFLGVVIERFPKGKPFVWGRSECDSCNHPLGPLDLVPFASWFVLQGRCRYCRARLSVFYPLIELGAVILAIWSATATTGWRFFASCAIGWVLLVVATIDWRERKRPYIAAITLILWIAWLYLPVA
jgi:leader peptidase (prepilin peptidase)/N-methyltransferase